MALTDKLVAIADAIRAKGGTTGTMTLDQMPEKITALSSKVAIEWHQCPEAVRNYLANVTYDPSDYSTSQIANYAPATALAANYRPIGKTLGGKTYCNEVPGIETPFASGGKAGTLKPLDALRWLNTPQAQNVRDLGGWSCDGGTVKYGLLFRGGQPTSADREVLVNQCGVRVDLDLRSTDTHDTGSPQNGGITVSPLGNDVGYVVAEDYNWYKLYSSHAETTDAWKVNMRCVIDNVSKGIPVYFHCSAGADRTATLACVIEGVLGMCQSDIDKDYELTCFSTGTDTDAHARRRNETEWKGLITAINGLPGSTFRDKCVNFVASLGFTAAEINAFRAAMIDGTPTTVTPSISTFTVANTLSHVTSDNASATATQYQPYDASIEPESGYDFESVSLTMGGTNIKASCYVEETYPKAKGRIKIPNVIGNIVLTASAIKPVPQYTNQIPISTDTDGSIYNSIGYKLATRINSSGAPVGYSSRPTVGATGFIPMQQGDVVRFKNCKIISTDANAGSFNVTQFDANKTKLSSNGSASWSQWSPTHSPNFSNWWTNLVLDDSGNVKQFTVANAATHYMRFTLLDVGESSVITVNEVIE